VASGGFKSPDPRKRLADLLAALVALPEDVALVVTGEDGPAAQAFRDRAERLGVAHRVELTGQLPALELVQVVAGAAVFAFPSAWEGFGLPLVEAMSVGLPCVVADGGALGEVGGAAATVVPVGKARDLAGALEELLQDSAKAAEASRRATTRAAEFSVQRFAQAHLDAYQSA
jgi:alpha-1,3-rhamnosyl/mannosyltransferase